MSNVDIGRYSKRLVKLLWDPEPKNDENSHAPIWLLGLKYDSRPQVAMTAPRTTSLPSPPASVTSSTTPSNDTTSHSPPTSPSVQSSREWSQTSESYPSSFEEVDREQETDSVILEDSDRWPDSFLDDFESIIWLTYRSNFPPIPRSQDPKATSAMSLSVRLKAQLSQQSGFTSDTGWGCMIRSGQSLLANTIATLRLGRERGASRQTQADEKEILSLFADDARAPFSIHKFVEHGAAACGTYPGQWFGPSATSKCIEALCNNYASAGLKVYVTGDHPDVFEDKLLHLAKPTPSSTFCPTLLLVGTRLGIDRITPAYRAALRASLALPQSVGIAGGRPASSHYFVGTQGETSFFYLDPHVTRPALPFQPDGPDELSDEEVASCHTRRLRRCSVEDMDPSMLIGFLFVSEDDWRDWRRRVEEWSAERAAAGDARGAGAGAGASMPKDKQIFHISDTAPTTPLAASGASLTEYLGGQAGERREAVDEVESIDDYDEDDQEDRVTVVG